MLFQTSMTTLKNSIHKREMPNVIWRAAGNQHDSYLRDNMCITRLRQYAFHLDETARVIAKYLQNCNNT